jgi:hypothetical protein
MDFGSLPKVKYDKNMLQKNKCRIDGDLYPLFIGKIIKMMENGTQPRILMLADPGMGKTWGAGRLAEILHDELDVLEEDFQPEEQILGDPLQFSKKVRNDRKKIFCVPDADSVFPSDEYHTASNKNNRHLIYLSRRFNNILLYDAHEMSRCAKAIRTNHNIRLVSVGNGSKYKFIVKRIQRENDSQTEEIEELDLGTWKPDKPSKTTQTRIEKLDKEEKEKKLVDSEDKIKMKRKKQRLKQQAFS